MKISPLILLLSAILLPGTMLQTANAAEETKLPKEFSVTIKPGKNHEECIEVKKDAEIAYRFNASQPVRFNIHYHAGKGSNEKVEYSVNLDKIDTKEDVLRAPIDQHYCWMWSNKTVDSVTVSGLLSMK